MIRRERESRHPDREGTVSGDIEAVPAPATGDSYVIIKKKKQEEAAALKAARDKGTHLPQQLLAWRSTHLFDPSSFEG